MPRQDGDVTTDDLRLIVSLLGVVSLSEEIGKTRHSTVTLLLTTITEVLMGFGFVHAFLGLRLFVGWGFRV